MAQISPFHYLISSKRTGISVSESALYSHSGYEIYIHPNNSENLICLKNIIFFGECFDFENPEHSNREIVEYLQHCDFKEKIDKIERLSGFFIIIFSDNRNTYVFNDATGQLEIFICQEGSDLYISSQPNLITQISKKTDYHDNLPSYIASEKINIFSRTPYKSITKLISNFYYDVNERKHSRLPRTHYLPKLSNYQVAGLALDILQNSIVSMAYRKNLGIAVTAGWDSRILFASSLSSSENISYYVLNHQSEYGRQDVKTAKEIADCFAKKLNIIDYDLVSAKCENENIDLWKDDEKIRKISNVMNNHYPNAYLLNGNVSEIARNFYDPLPRKLSVDDVCYIIGIKNGNYEKEAVSEWLSHADHNVHVLDSIYWEHKMPNWAGSNKSISNTCNTVISPFNNSYLLNLLLSTNRRDRDKYFHKIYLLILEMIDDKLTKIPINPTKKNLKITLMKRLHVYPAYRYVYFRSRKLKF